MVKNLKNDRNAVVSIVAALLLIGSMVILLVTVRLDYVPVWMQDTEAQHMEDVSNSMSWLKSAVDLQVISGSAFNTSSSTPVVLGAGGMPFMGIPGTSGTISFSAGQGAAMEVSAGLMTLIEENGAYYAGCNETWISIVGNTVQNVSSISSFRLLVSEISKKNVSDYAEVSIYDSRGALAGTIRLYIVSDPPDFDMYVKTTAPDGTVLFNGVTREHISHTIYGYFENLLNANYRFDRLVAAASKPIRISLVEGGLDADYAISYREYTSSGTTIEHGGGGMNVSNYHRTYRSGALNYTSSNNYYVNQKHSYQTGMLMLNQSDGWAILTQPPVSFSLAGNITMVNVNLPALTGTNNTLSSNGKCSVKTSLLSTGSVRGATSNLTLVFRTGCPALLADRLRESLRAAGLNETRHDFGFAATASSVSLYIAGLDHSSYNDVYLNMQVASIKVEIGS